MTTNRWLRWVRTIISFSSLAIALTSLSVIHERRSSELAIVGNVCGPLSNEVCVEGRMAAGFPFAFLYDRPSTSIGGELHVGEDDFRTIPFALNILLWLGVLLLIDGIAVARRSRAVVEPVSRPSVVAHTGYAREISRPER